MMKIKGIAKMDEERISQRVLYVIVALSAIVFLAFYLIGYDTPFAGNTAFNAPMLTDVFAWVYVGIACYHNYSLYRCRSSRHTKS